MSAVVITVVPITPALADLVRALRVAPDQYAYLGDVAFNLLDSERDAMSEAMAVLANDRAIGFYRLDFAPNTVAGRDLGEPSVGLRCFFIDHRLQGRGYGRRAVHACCEDLRGRHPGRRLLLLAVDCVNAAAIAMYRRAGFVDSGEVMFGGCVGPQHLFILRLYGGVAGK